MADQHRQTPWRRRALPAVLAGLVTVLSLVVGPAGLPPTSAAFSATSANPGNALAADRLAPPTGLVATQTCAGAGTVTPRGAVTAFGGSTIVLTQPAGTQTDDLIVVQVAHGDPSVAVTPPSGWNTLRADTSGGLVAATVFWKLAVAGAGSVSFTRPSSSAGDMVAGMVVYGGVDRTTPIAVSGSTTGTGTKATTPSLTTTATGTMVLHLLAKKYEDLPVPSGDTQRWRLTSSNKADAQGATAFDQALAGPGAVPPQASTSATNTSSPWIAQTVVVRHTPGTPSAALSWTASPSTWATGYMVENQAGAATPTRRSLPLGPTSTTDTSVTNGTTYTFRLWAYRGTWTSAAVTAALTPDC
jgi:hypothetical protein